MIKIITLYNSYNVGAFLQAYSLYTVLKKKKLSVEFLDVGQNPDEYFCRQMKYIRNPFEIFFQLKQRNKYRKAVRDYFKVSDKCSNVEDDYIIVGSDEMWNVQNGSFSHLPEYFGKNLKCKKMISYAVSGNGVSSIDVKTFNSEFDLDSFDAISVRDIYTLNLARDLSEQQVKKVCDPTILLNDFDVNARKRLDYDYVLVYAYQSNLSDSEKKSIMDYAKRNGLKTVSVSLYNPWCDVNITATPLEFLGYLKNAKSVVTSTFHGTVLSIILNKQFYTYAHTNEKICEILADLFLEQRIVDKIDFYEELPDIKYTEVNEKLLLLQQDSSAWLDEQLKVEVQENG